MREPTKLSRRTFLSATSMAALAACVPMSFSKTAFAASAVPLTVALDWVADVEFSNIFVARANGYFAKHGVDVSYIPGGPSAPDPLISLAANRAQIGQCIWTPFLNAVQKQNDFVILGAAFPVNPGCIISLPGKPIRTAADIVGKTLLIQFPSLEEELKGLLAYNQIQGEFAVRPTGFTADSLFAGDGEGYLAFITNQPLELEARGMVRGKDFIVTMLSEMNYPLPSSIFTVKREVLERNRPQLVSFFKGVLEGQAFCAENPDKAVLQVVENDGSDLGLDAANQKQVLAENLKLATATDTGVPFLITPDQQAAMIKFARAIGVSGLNAPERYFDSSVLAEAAKSLGYVG
jgi:ABC-type nitrate/sulfonate/bicarbonate transport system substrate-binding protein